MSEFQAGFFGAFVGVAIAVLGNLLMLPAVLKAQKKRYDSGWKPLFGKTNPELKARMTKVHYRFVMPLLFAFVGFQFGTKLLGAH